MKRSSLRQPFNRGDTRAILHDGQGQARKYAPAIDQHGARAALAMVTTLLRARQVEGFSQQVEQRLPDVDLELPRFAVYGQLHAFGCHDSPPKCRAPLRDEWSCASFPFGMLAPCRRVGAASP